MRTLLCLTLFLQLGRAGVAEASCPEVSGPVQEICSLCTQPFGSAGFNSAAGQGFERAQTFVVEHTGRLQAVEIMSGARCCVNGTGGVAIVELRPIVGGKPAEDPATALLSVQYTEAQLSTFRQWSRFDFGDAAIHVAQGQALALVIRGTGPWSIEWSAGSVMLPDDIYPGGKPFLHGPTFPTWTSSDVAEPGRNSDYSFRFVTCDDAVSASAASWGRLKAHYR